jgi:predicted nuclease of predicted toxin-antitoxin system
VRLLFDHNLSPRLVERLADVYEGATHVYLLGLERASDHTVWLYAKEHGFTIVSRDADFSDLSIVLGFPPKVIWIRSGNCSTAQIEQLLRAHHQAITALDDDPATGVLALFSVPEP